MIPQEQVLQRIDAYLAREHPELPPEWQKHHMPFLIEDFRKYPIIPLRKALQLPSPVYFCHNGMAHLGMQFENLVAYFGAHPDPIQIPIQIEINELLGGSHSCYHRRHLDTGFSTYSFFEDTDYRVEIDKISYRFLEGLFGLKYATFRSSIVEPGYGLRIDRDGQLGAFFAKVLSEGTLLFLDKIDIGEGDNDRAYVINGFEI